MKAAVYRQYGRPLDVVRIEEVEKPVPAEDEVLIAVRAASVNPADTHRMRGKPAIVRLGFGVRGPKLTRPGVDLAGEVEAVGAGVTLFKPGDAVFGACRGSLADFACAPQAKLAPKPPSLSFEQTASLPVAGLTALQGLRDHGRLEPGQKVLIIGAAGGIGTFAVQIAKALGAHVTAVCSARNLDLARSIGADRAIDYGKEDYLSGGECYDLVFDLVSSRSFRSFGRILAPEGILLPAGMMGGGGAPRSRWLGPWAVRTIGGLLRSRFTRRKMVMFVAKLNREDLIFLGELVATGKVTPVVDRRQGLPAAATALHDLQTGHARGKIVVTMDPAGRIAEA